MLLLIISVLAAAAAGIFCILGLKARESGSAYKPKELASPSLTERGVGRLKVRIIKAWLEGIDDFNKAGLEKRKCLDQTATMVGIAIIAIALDIILGSLIGVCSA